MGFADSLGCEGALGDPEGSSSLEPILHVDYSPLHWPPDLADTVAVSADGTDADIQINRNIFLTNAVHAHMTDSALGSERQTGTTEGGLVTHKKFLFPF